LTANGLELTGGPLRRARPPRPEPVLSDGLGGILDVHALCN